jgi:hypothetical protein
MILSLGAGAFMFTACDRNQTHTTGTTTPAGTANTGVHERGTAAHGGMHATDQDAVYRDQATRTSGQMAQDMRLDDGARSQVEEIHYNRAQRRAEAQQRFGTDQEGMNREMQQIDQDTDRDIRGVLTAEQYRLYEQNRNNYADQNNYELNRTGTDHRGGMDADRDMNNRQLNHGTQQGQQMDTDRQGGTFEQGQQHHQGTQHGTEPGTQQGTQHGTNQNRR